jgi:serine/threonine protein kinase
MSELIGQTIGNYRLEALLGSGGMGQVFRGRHVHLDRLAAVKVMHDLMASDPGFQARFRQEARAIAALRHPHIIEIFDFGAQDERYYLVMELLPEGSLRALLRRQTAAGETRPLSQGLDLVRQAAEAVAFAHGQGIIHRDIKPDNMLLAPSTDEAAGYCLKISDFGLARLAERSIMTASGVTMGTPAYISPEQCQGLDLDGRTDIYSLGIVLYEVATGYLPFDVKTLSEAVYKHVYTAPPPPREVCADLPVELSTIILRCLAKKPEERFASAAELAVAVQGALADPAVATVCPTAAGPPDAPRTVPPLTVPQPASPATPPPVPTGGGTSPVPRVHVLDENGETQRVVELTGDGLTLGRLPDNDVVLAADAVSRHHLRVDWDGSEVTVTDLGSSNGTVVDGARLTPNAVRPWTGQEVLQVGPFWLRVEEPAAGPELLTMESPRTGVQPPPGVAPPAPGPAPAGDRTGRIGVVLDHEAMTLTPGQPAVARVTLANLGSTVDHLAVTVEGVPESWVTGGREPVQLNPGAQATVTVPLTVPRVPESRAGDYPVTIRARSRKEPAETGTATARWTVLPFTAPAMGIEPGRAGGQTQATYGITVRNGGNSPTAYVLTGADEENALSYDFQPEQVALEPGAAADVRLTVQAPQRWIGIPQVKSFTVRSQPAGGAPAPAEAGPPPVPAQFVHRVLIPVWLPPVLALMIPLGIYLFTLFVPRPTADLQVDKEVVTRGEPVTLTWRVRNASSIVLEPLGEKITETEGSRAFTPDGPTTYELVATSRWGTARAKRLVGMNEAPVVISEFKAEPKEIKPGGTTPITLTWKILNAASAEIQGTSDGPVTVDKEAGSLSVPPPPETKNYTLVATDRAGVKTPKTVTVTRLPELPEITFKTSASSIAEGKKVTLTWAVKHAEKVALSITSQGAAAPDIPVDATGTRSETPEATTVYTLKATGYTGKEKATDPQTVTVKTGVPKLFKPRDGDEFVIRGPDHQPVQMEWEQVIRRGWYEVALELDHGGGSWNPYGTNKVFGNIYMPQLSLGDNTYRWRVRAISPTNGEGEWSGWRTFTVRSTYRPGGPTRAPAGRTR